MSTSLARYFARNPARFVTGYRHSPQSPACGFHSHEHVEIVSHARGSGTAELADGTRIPFRARSAAVYPPRLVHNQLADSPAEDCCLYLALEGSPPAELRQSQHLEPIDDSVLHDEIVRLTALPSRLDALQQLTVNYRATAVLLQLLGQVSSALEPAPARENHAQRAKLYIDAHFATLAGMDEVARQIEVSTSYLRHAFREAFGFSLIDYLSEIRIERAKDLLEHSTLPQKAIADLCGFGSERYLSTRFRLAVGCTPGEFRARAARSR
jgi:AraC-like DNA-binding protein